MEKKIRRKFSADFKAKVVIESLKERSTIEQLAQKHELHPTQISTWKKDFLTNASAIFKEGDSAKDDHQQRETDLDKLYSQIGRLKVENDFLKKKLQ